MKLLEVTKTGNIYVEDSAGNEWRFAFYEDGAVATQRKSSDGHWYASKASAAVVRFARKHAARKNPTKPTIEKTFESFGFRFTNTGGGSTAYERRLGRNGYALVTVDEGGTGFDVPKRLSEATLLGVYSDRDDNGKYYNFRSLREFFQALEAGKIKELR